MEAALEITEFDGEGELPSWRSAASKAVGHLQGRLVGGDGAER